MPIDITANPVDGKLYAISRKAMGSGDIVLCTVDRETGEQTKLADLPPVWTISCDANGQLYAITQFNGGGIYHGGDLYKVNTDGSTEFVGFTGLSMYDAEKSATIDYRSGKMYLSHYGHQMENGKPNYNYSVLGLYEIDLQTGVATLLHYYDDYSYITGLSVMNANPLAPDLVTDLQFAPKTAGSFTGVVTYSVPTLTYGQSQLTGDVKATYYLDGVEAATDVVSAGQKVTKELTISAEGNHTVTVALNANGFNGVPEAATAFFGTDSPDQVSNLTLTATNNSMTANLSWDAPTGSLNGGAFDPEQVRYQIVRYPGAVTVARAATNTSFTEDVDYQYANTYYVVTPYIAGDTNKKGRSVRSNKAFLGSAWEMPYAEPFDSSNAWASFTVIDANGDGGDWGLEDAIWMYDSIYYCAFYYASYYSNGADDWMITPKLALEEGKLYRLTFQLYGYNGNMTNHLRVFCGNEATVEGMHNMLYDEETMSSQSAPLTVSRLFAPTKGDMYIGFHNITENLNHLSIDNILVEEVGSAAVPAPVEDLEAAIVNRAEGKVRLTFKAPAKTAGDEALTSNITVKIYRGSETTPLKTFSDVKPGEALTYDDNEAAPSQNIYRVVPENAEGVGQESSVSIDLRAGEPVSVSNVMATLISPNQVRLTWSAPSSSVDANGNEIDVDNLRYLVYRPMDNDQYDLIGRGLTECEFIDDNPRARYGDTQAAIMYYVAAVNADGESVAAPSNVVYVGESYKLPFAETWKEQAAESNPWLVSNNGTAGWYPAYKGYSPMCDGQDGNGVMSLDVNPTLEEGSSILWTPRIDFSDVKDATLTLWIYGENTYKDKDYIGIGVAVEGQDPVRISSATFYPRGWAGWKKQTVDLSAYVGNTSVSILIMGNIVAQGDERRIHIDNLEITGTPVDNELKITGISGPSSVRSGIANKYTVTVANSGTADAENIPVTLYSDDRQVMAQTIAYLNAGESTEVEFEFTAPEGSDDLIELLAEINPVAGADTNMPNNSVTMAVAVQPLNLPYVTDLVGTYFVDRNEATLEWSNPSEAEFTEVVVDGAENYDAFAISEFGCWSVLDADGNLPFKFQDPDTGVVINWDNNDVAQAWMVFRPSDVTSDRTFEPNSGLQTFISWSNADIKQTGIGNDDWLISPELSGDNQLISFYVRRLNERDSNEKYNVLYSTTDTDPASFKRLNGDTPLSAAAEWELKYFALPEGTKYFAIQYVGYHQSALLVDDIQFEAYPTHMRPDGYNIYRNGQQINTSLVGRKNYTDRDLTYGESYSYTVCPVYFGVEAAPSRAFIVDTTGIMTPGTTGAVAVMSGKGFLRVMNAQGLTASVYSVDGKQIASRRIVTENDAISVSAGIYVVSVGDKTFKVVVR